MDRALTTFSAKTDIRNPAGTTSCPGCGVLCRAVSIEGAARARNRKSKEYLAVGIVIISRRRIGSADAGKVMTCGEMPPHQDGSVISCPREEYNTAEADCHWMKVQNSWMILPDTWSFTYVKSGHSWIRERQ
jgi:hypothetical protein